MTHFLETEQGVAQAIIKSHLDFKRDPWPNVSDTAKDLVRKMLNPDPTKRHTAQEVLGIRVTFVETKMYFFVFIGLTRFLLLVDHPWLQNTKNAPNVSLGETVKARLKQFSLMNKLKKRALRVTFS